MALSSKITNIYIRQKDYDTANDWKYEFIINSAVSELGQVNYGSAFDEAIDGSLRHNLRGFRITVNLDWGKLLSSTAKRTLFGGSQTSSTIGALLTDLVDALVTDSDSYVEVSFDDTNWIKVVPDAATYRTAYTNQIGRGSSSITLIGQEILTSIPAYLEAPSV